MTLQLHKYHFSRASSLEENGKQAAVMSISLQRDAKADSDRRTAIVALADGRIFSVYLTLNGAIHVLSQTDLVNVLPASVCFIPGQQGAVIFNCHDGELYVFKPLLSLT